MKREISDELISAYLDGELAADEAKRVEQLLLDSAEHRKLFAELRDMGNKIRELPQATLPADFSKRVLESANRELQAETQTLAAKPAAVEQSTGPNPAPENWTQLPPQRGGWVVAVVLASTAAAAVVALLAFPPDLGQLGGNAVALSPNDAIESKPDEVVAPVEESKDATETLAPEEPQPAMLKWQEVNDEQARQPLVGSDPQAAESPDLDLRHQQDKKGSTAANKSSRQMRGTADSPQGDTRKRLGEPVIGTAGRLKQGDLDAGDHELSLKEAEEENRSNQKSKVELRTSGDIAQQSQPAPVSPNVSMMKGDDLSAAVPPLLVSPEYIQPAQTAGLKLTIVELSKVVTDHAFADSLRDHSVRLDRLDSLGLQDIERNAAKNAESDGVEADAYQLAILEGEPQNIAAALAEFEVQSQSLIETRKSRREVEKENSRVADFAEAKGESAGAGGGFGGLDIAPFSAPSAADSYGLPAQPAQPGALKSNSQPAAGDIASRPPRSDAGNRYSAPTSRPAPAENFSGGSPDFSPQAIGGGTSSASQVPSDKPEQPESKSTKFDAAPQDTNGPDADDARDAKPVHSEDAGRRALQENMNANSRLA